MVVYCSFSSGPIWVLLKPSGLLAEQPSTMYKICQNKSKYHRIVEVTQQSYESCQYHSRRVVRSERFLTDLRSMQFSQRSSANQPWNLEHPQHKHHQLQRKTLIDQYSFMYNRKQDHQTMASSSHFITRSSVAHQQFLSKECFAASFDAGKWLCCLPGSSSCLHANPRASRVE